MLAPLYRLWGWLPDPVRAGVVRTGLPYVGGFVLHYRSKHRGDKFAGRLEDLKRAYGAADAALRDRLSQQFAAILDALVLPNAVTKTTWAKRLGRTLSQVLPAVRLPATRIRVLDVPSSAGIASLEGLDILRTSYDVSAYVLGDKYHEVLYDAHRGCIFDCQGRLLQVAFRDYYFSIYRGHVTGNAHTLLSSILLLPHSILAWYLRRRHRFDPGANYHRLLLLHPEVEARLSQDVLQLEDVDVFQPIPGRYDLILSFNLLQRNYFPAATIAAAVANLAAALREGGVLLMGNTDSYVALQKQAGKLIARAQRGSF